MRFMTKTLELHTILEMISSHAKTDTIKEDILNLEPMIEEEMILESLEETYDMTTLVSRASFLPLIDDFDIQHLLKYAHLNRSYTIQDLLYIRLFLSMERDVLKYGRELDRMKISSKSIGKYFSSIISNQSLLQLIDSKMDPDGQILDDATPELFSIRKEISRHEKTLQDRLNKMLIDYSSYLNEAVIVIRNNRFCIPVKDAFKNKIKGVIHDMSASKQTIYIEPEQTRQITAEIETLKIKEENEIQKIIYFLSEQVQQSYDALASNLDIFLHLDFLQAKAIYAKNHGSNRPSINKRGFIKLVKAKHPLLNPLEAVPIDVELSDQLRILLITGPNTGGKTVALKTVGLLTLMTQCGLLIPASESSEIAIFDQVFADIGDEQSIMQSLSTFSSHLTKIIKMTEEVTDNTLVLLDELGSGTDPNEGVSLAIAILNHFKTYNLRMMVTTHYSELKSYAYEQNHMGTASVAFDKKTLKPLYFLQMGTTGSSHAFLIAKRLGLKDEIINDANVIYQGRQTDLQKVMEKLNDEMLYLESQKEKVRAELEKARTEKKNYHDLKEKLIAEQDQIIQKIKDKEEKKWHDLKEEVRALILDLQNKKSLSNPEIAQIKYQLNQKAEEEHLKLFDEELIVGDQVYIMSYQQYGTIKAIKNDDYKVSVGQFDLTFKSTDLRKETMKKPEKKELRPKKVSEDQTPTKKGNYELDLRGFRFDEVKDAMDQAIDSALLSGLSVLRIIHGFGSGAVRKAVYDYIRQSPYVKTHRFGGEGEGLNGVTIITLK
ncbi:MAG: endonuclease MutS2 [Bacillota bacterium]|nr:MAG: endonuclease MutS2 [Bacillota bacterium]